MTKLEQDQQQSQDKQDDNNTITTTRVCIKNVPLSFTETKLTQHLVKNSSMNLIVTDCKILSTSSNKSRRMAFCGFKDTKMALHVIQRFHKTYAQTSKLSVEPAFLQKQKDQHRPWSKHSVGSSRYEKAHPAEKEKENKTTKEEENKQDTVEPAHVTKRKEEFLSAMMMGSASSKRNIWSNDDVDILQDAPPKEQDDQSLDNSDSTTVSSSSSDSSDSDDSSSSCDSVDSGGKGADIMQGRSVASKAGGTVISDMDFMHSKMTATENLTDHESDDDEEKQGNDDSSTSSSSAVSSSSSDEEEDGKMDNKHEEKVKGEQDQHTPQQAETTKVGLDEQEIHPKQQEEATSNTRLFCRNLPFSTTEEELSEWFQKYGKVAECHVAVDDQKRNKGFAFVGFATEDSATRARLELDGTDFQGRLLHILPAKRRPQDAHQEAATTFKQKAEQLRKQNASQLMGANASFVRGDAVVDNLSERLGLKKGDILSVKDGLSSGDAAVRLALGETHVIEENREYFRNEGIDMDALVSGGKEESVKRSNTSILVKNLPYDTALEDMTKLFHGVGGDAPRRILLPPSRTIALVEYGHSVDARRAFKKLAYKRFKHVPLYLEWAPLCAATKEEGSSDVENASTKASLQTKQIDDENQQLEEADTEGGAETLGVSHSIYVNNLNFATTEEELRQVFVKHVKSIRAVKIPTKAAPIKRGAAIETTKLLSLGYGFVECDSDESVRKAIKALQGTVVNGHAMELKRSAKQLTSNKRVAALTSERNPTKLMVRNVPFQATRKELLQLFGSFGQLKKVRLPKKFDGSHRGFAFVEFLTSQEAQTAMNTLSRTHLYGRHLVLEWASDKEDMSELRDKAKRDVFGSERKNKKIRFE